MANIVVVTRFKEAGSSAFANYINYIDRNEATRKDNLEKFNLFEGYTEYMDNDEKTVFDRGQSVEKVSALFTRNNDSLNAEEKKKLKHIFNIAEKNGSNMWQTVISFENNYLENLGIYNPKENSLNEKYLISAARKAIDKMLVNEKLQNATWSAAIHYNTDNIHIHIAIVEPKPMRARKIYKIWEQNVDGSYKMTDDINGNKTKIPVLDESGKQKTRRAFIGRFKNKSHELLKSELNSELDNNKEAYIEINNLMRRIVDSKKEIELFEDVDFQEKMNSLYEDLKAEKVINHKTNEEQSLSIRYWNYNQNSISHLRQKIDEISDLFIKRYNGMEFEEMISKMEIEAKKQENIYGGSSDYVKNKLYASKDGLYARLGNTILKELINYEKDRLEQIKAISNGSEMLNPDSDKYNPTEGIKALKELANRGNTFAQNKLGLIYIKGDVVKKDITKAKLYFEASSSNGNEYGKKMAKAISEGKLNKYSSIYNNWKSKRDFNRAIRLMRKSMQKEYINYINQREAEELQHEIDRRGSYGYEI